jgi:hypothetical protein
MAVAIKGWEWDHGESVFRNTVNGYDGEYYSYILCVLLPW